MPRKSIRESRVSNSERRGRATRDDNGATGSGRFGNTGLRTWWQEFRATFSAAHPEKQVEQVYHVTAIAAVIASIIGGLWALAADSWDNRADIPLGTSAAAGGTNGPTATESPKLSIVVFPFVNLNGDAAQDYFVDGITDSLTTDLSRALPGSFVIARATAFTYKGKAVDARQIGVELHVRYLLEGSVLLNGERVRVNARLVDTQLGNEIWSERFDAARSDALLLQDEIVGRLSRTIGLQVVSFAARGSDLQKPNIADATDLVLRARATLNRPSSAESMIAARGLFEQALKLQPDNVDALAGVATTNIFEVLNSYYSTDNNLRLQRAEIELARALALDDRHLGALKARAALLRAQGRFEEAIAASKTVIAQNPGEPWAYKEVGLSLMYLGETVEALQWFDKAERFGPRDPGRWTWLGGKGQALVLLGRDGEAIASLQEAVESNPADVSDYAVLAAAYALSDRSEEARAAVAKYQQFRPETRVSTFRSLTPVPLQLTSSSYLRQRERLKEGLRRAGMPE